MVRLRYGVNQTGRQHVGLANGTFVCFENGVANVRPEVADELLASHAGIISDEPIIMEVEVEVPDAAEADDDAADDAPDPDPDAPAAARRSRKKANGDAP